MKSKSLGTFRKDAFEVYPYATGILKALLLDHILFLLSSGQFLAISNKQVYSAL